MKRAGLQNSKLLRGLLLLATLSFQINTLPIASALSTGSAPCVQSVDSTSGVSVYLDGNYCYVAFKSVQIYSWTPPAGVTSINLLVVAGGGGGGSRHAGGGGAGGVVNSTGLAINSSALSISVGGGGAGGLATSNAGAEGSNGNDSQVSGGGISTLTAGGGGGGGYTLTSGSGPSSGGGGCCGQSIGTLVTGKGAGFAGGAGHVTANTIYAGGGGGGAGAQGSAATSAGSGAGGTGANISWITSNAQSNLSVGVNSGGSTYVAGGGGGGVTCNNGCTAGGGGTGGGGAGTKVDAASPGSGTSNTGGGGGGSGISGGGAVNGGDGGSGVVVIRYLADLTAPTVSTLSITSTSGSDNFYGLGDTITVTIVWSETVTVTGTPRVPIQGLTAKYLSYGSGTGTKSLIFNYTVANGDLDRDGLSISANTLELNSGTIKDQVSNDATLSHGAVSATIALRIDGVPPTLSNMSIPSSGTTINIGFSETISSTISSYSQFTLMVGSVQNAVSAGVTADSRLTMNLSFGVVSGAVVTLTYTDPTTGNDVNAIQDEAGNDLASFSSQSVSNLSIKTTNTSVSLALDPSAVTAVYRAPTSVKATVTAAGKVSFFHNGKIVVACRNVATTGTSPFYATCSWKPSVQQYVSLTASYKSTTAGYTDSTSSDLRIYVTRRSGLR